MLFSLFSSGFLLISSLPSLLLSFPFSSAKSKEFDSSEDKLSCRKGEFFCVSLRDCVLKNKSEAEEDLEGRGGRSRSGVLTFLIGRGGRSRSGVDFEEEEEAVGMQSGLLLLRRERIGMWELETVMGGALEEEEDEEGGREGGGEALGERGGGARVGGGEPKGVGEVGGEEGGSEVEEGGGGVVVVGERGRSEEEKAVGGWKTWSREMLSFLFWPLTERVRKRVFVLPKGCFLLVVPYGGVAGERGGESGSPLGELEPSSRVVLEGDNIIVRPFLSFRAAFFFDF